MDGHAERRSAAIDGVLSKDLFCLSPAACAGSQIEARSERAPGQHSGSSGPARAGDAARTGAAHGRNAVHDVVAGRAVGPQELRDTRARQEGRPAFDAAALRERRAGARGELRARYGARGEDAVAAFTGRTSRGACRSGAAGEGGFGADGRAGEAQKARTRTIAGLKRRLNV